MTTSNRKQTKRQRMFEFRNQLALQVANEFRASEIEHTCHAVLREFAMRRIVELKTIAPYREFAFDAMWTAHKLTNLVEKELNQ